MKKIFIRLSLALAACLLISNSAMALVANHTYTVKLSTLSTDNLQTMVEEVSATTDINGKLSFQFSNVPDTSMTPFLMVEVIDMASGQAQVVRQGLVPAPASGQSMQMGVSEISHRQTQATLRAFNDAGRAEPLRAMFPLTMMTSGALSDTDVGNLGIMADDASSALAAYLTQKGVSATQMEAFGNGLMEAMRARTAECKLAVDEIDAQSAASRRGRAAGEFMQTMIDAAADAGIDPELMSSAFDQAQNAVENTPADLALSVAGSAMLDDSFMTGRQQRRAQAQLRHYAEAMGMFNTDPAQVQTFTTARTNLQEAMLVARQDYQQIFVDPTNLPGQLTIDQAQTSYQTAMQSAMDNFLLATTATDLQIGNMLGQMATRMMTGGMMGGGMMNGSDLSTLGFGQMMLRAGDAPQNWTTMMVAASDLIANTPIMDYQPITADLLLELGQLQNTLNLPTEPDWSLLPNDANRSLLQLQLDLMLAEMIDRQMLANFTLPLSAQDQARLSAHHLANQALIAQGLQGLTSAQADALMNAMSPLHQI
ncbi:MAG: hypothetical protein L3J63_10085 [Geopsychrobacter sp.]|nr:hypothetical protein [Geopsychrobacter sp.]